MGTIMELLSAGWLAAIVGIAARAVAVLIEEQPSSTLRLLMAVPAGILFAVAARRLRFLDRRGAAVGGLLAASVVGLGGVAWAIPSFVFFMLSSLLSGVGRWRKAALAVQTEKGSERDAGQVLANGGVGWLLLVFYALFPLPLLYWGFVGAAGVLGSLGDSLIGATLQAQYWEPRSGRLTERPVSQGVMNELVTGRRWMTNDRVNAPGTLLGALVAMACFPGSFLSS